MRPDERLENGRRFLLSKRAVSLFMAVLCTVGATMSQAQSIVQVDIQLDGARLSISPWIYGVNYSDEVGIERPYPLVRWGGNHTTRYSWEDDVSNRARDWFFMNIPYDHPDPAQLPVGSTVDRLVEWGMSEDADVLLTTPIIGWTPLDRERRWGFSVAKYGLQQETAPGDPDAGNGVHLDGSFVTGNDPEDTSRAIDSTFVADWLSHLAEQFGSPGEGGVRLYALDNEPMSWHETHRDVHPTPVTYDEIWARTVEYASVIKAFDPDALVLGPVIWGWCAFWGSAADRTSPEGGCGYGPDRLAHDDIPFLLWYLQQICAYEAEYGIRLVDILDVHYYPSAWGVALSSDESGEVADRRLRSVRSLNDPDYVDESWINQSINLIPMLRGIVSENCPGLQVAITEYNWGNDEGASSALAQAEVLAIFGAEGVDLATRWVVPKLNTPVEDAFLLYLDYDGMGSQVMGDSIEATSDDPLNVPVYAIAGDYGRIYTLLFNKTWDAKTAVVTLSSPMVGEVQVFGFDGSTRLGPRSSVDVADGGFTVELPPRSVTLAVAHDGTPLPEDEDEGDGPSDSGSDFDDRDTSHDMDGTETLDDPADAAIDPERDPEVDEDRAISDRPADSPLDSAPDGFDVDFDDPGDLVETGETTDPISPSDDGCGCAAIGIRHRSFRPWIVGLALALGTWIRQRIRCGTSSGA